MWVGKGRFISPHTVYVLLRPFALSLRRAVYMYMLPPLSSFAVLHQLVIVVSSSDQLSPFLFCFFGSPFPLIGIYQIYSVLYSTYGRWKVCSGRRGGKKGAMNE